MAGSIVMTMKGHWLSAGWLRVTAVPFIRIDGVEQRVRWGVACPTRVDAGRHVVAGGIRYRGFSSLLGVRDVIVDVVEGQAISLVARNGLLNSEPFYVTPAR